MMRNCTDYIEFKNKFIDTVAEQDEEPTLRIGKKGRFSPGQRVALTNEDRVAFATAKVKVIKRVRLIDLTLSDLGEHHDIETLEELAKVLSNLYREEIGPQTEVQLIQLIEINEI